VSSPAQAVAERLFAAIFDRDPEAASACIADDAVFWTNIGPVQTREEFVPMFLHLIESIPDVAYTQLRRIDTPDGYVQQHVLTGTSPQGQPFSVDACSVVTVRDGLIVRWDEYLDSDQVAGIGLGPA